MEDHVWMLTNVKTIPESATAASAQTFLEVMPVPVEKVCSREKTERLVLVNIIHQTLTTAHYILSTNLFESLLGLTYLIKSQYLTYA